MWLPTICALFLAACGLPDYLEIDPPKVIDTTSSDVMVGFVSPSADTDILGYVLYYKVYDDPNDYQDDKDYFDNASSELQPGGIELRTRSFSKAGIETPSQGRILPADATTNIRELDNDGDEEYYFIHANSTGESSSNDREEPEVGYLEVFDPDIDPLPSTFGSLVDAGITITRGYTDPTKVNWPLLSFVNDWIVGAVITDYFDGDLRNRGTAVPSQPGSSSDLSTWQTYAPIYTSSPLPTNLYVGFVAYSVGIDVTGGSLNFYYSQPVHLGRIMYSEINNDTR